jgi:DNA-binding NarL/FixJ family response regulator
MSWDSQFAEPIDLPNHVVATTLRHVIAYISELPDAERNSREWQNAHKHILQAADQVGSIWFARIAIIQALKHRTPRFRRRSWSPEELRLLDKLVADGASPRTAAEALNRSEETVRTKARRIGRPFPHRDEVKRQRPLTQEEAELPQLAR